MPIRDACRVLWGTNYENSTTFPYPIAGAVTRRVRRQESRLFQSYTGVEDSHNLGFDYLLSGSLEYIEDKPRTSPTVADGWSGANGVQAFLDYARDQRPFRFVPSTQTPDFWVDKCTLVDPIDTDPPIGEDVTRRLDFTFRTQHMDFSWALRGVALELGPGLIYGSGAPRLEQQSSGNTYHSRAGLVVNGAANTPRTRHHYPRRDRNDSINSEALDVGGYTPSQASITANATVAPDGLTTAEKLVENTANSAHAIFGGTITVMDGEYVFGAVYIKPGERTAIRCHLVNDITTLGWRINVNLTNRTVSAAVQVGSHSGTVKRDARLDDVGSGWFRLTFVASIGGVTTAMWNLHLENPAGTNSYTGDGTSGLFLWGWQVARTGTKIAQSAPSEMGYVRTGTTAPAFKNLAPTQVWLQGSAGRNDALRSEEYDNAVWTKSNCPVTADTTTAPDGMTTADTAIPNTTAGVNHFVYQTVTITADEYFYASCFVKAAGYTGFRLWVSELVAGTNGFFVDVNLTTGDLIGTGLSGTGILVWARVTLLADGWCRIEASGAAKNAAASVQMMHLIYPNASSIGTVYAGDGTSGVHLWGGQIARTLSTLTPAPAFAYRKTTTGSSILAIDVTELDWPWPNQVMWGYAKFVEEGEAKRANFQDLLRIGDAASGKPVIRLFTGQSTAGSNPNWRFNWSHDGGTTQSGAILANAPLPGDVVELFFRLLSTGEVRIVGTVNGGAETSASGTGGVAPHVSYDMARRFRMLGAHVGLITLKVGFAPWITTMSQARFT